MNGSHTLSVTWKIWTSVASHGLVHFVESVLCSIDPMGRPATEDPNPCRTSLTLHFPGPLCRQTAKCDFDPLLFNRCHQKCLISALIQRWSEIYPSRFFSVKCGDTVQTRPADSCISRAEFLNKPKEACMELDENVAFDHATKHGINKLKWKKLVWCCFEYSQLRVEHVRGAESKHEDFQQTCLTNEFDPCTFCVLEVMVWGERDGGPLWHWNSKGPDRISATGARRRQAQTLAYSWPQS